MLRRIIFIIGICIGLSGCEMAPDQREARQLAEKRFHHQKAKIKHLLAIDQFEHGQITKAAESIMGAIALYPDDPQYYLLLAKIYIEQGELSQAQYLLSGASAHEMPNPEFSYLLGLVAERYGRLKEALGHYRQAHELEPRKTEYSMACGEMLISLNNPAEALHLIAENINDTADRARLQALNGEALQMLGRYEEAAAAFKQALVESPQDYSLLESYAMALFRAERYADAIVPLKRLYAQRRDQAPRHTVKALGWSCLEVGDHAAALSHLWEVTRADPKDVQAWLMLARCDLALNNLAEAKLAAERAVELDPEDNHAQTMLGFVLFSQENWIEARRALAAAYKADPNDVIALCLLGQVLEATGLPRRAAEYYKRALIADPNDTLARYLLQEFKSSGLGVRVSGLDDLRVRPEPRAPKPETRVEKE